MPPRIAIPMPHSIDVEYGQRAIPQYERAVALTGGEPVRIPLNQSANAVRAMLEKCDGVLLPGSNADVDPIRFAQERSPHTAAADAKRDEVDDLLLEDAYAKGKPVLGICYGLQSLNVFRKGSLIQHIPDFLPGETRTKINHEAGRKVAVAHTVEVKQDSLLGKVLGGDGRLGRPSKGEAERTDPRNGRLVVPVNSSHHQSADTIGEGLRVVAHCPDDGIIEALEGTSSDHFVLAVQWHPERSVDDDEHSRAIFHALIEEAKRFRG
jgi:putative glutamine amidotransferase